MIAAMSGYVIRGGKPGYDRLMLLARDRWADTRALLERAGISAGMRCIDIGCGGGEVTMEIARMVAPGGTVAGVDIDEVKLALARQVAAERGRATLSSPPSISGTGTSPAAMTRCMPGSCCST
jgi:ubiquinone/menaquinone biosynthesis C-methylase UbiE